jgi:hypothetical protein
MKPFKYLLMALAVTMLGLASCVKDLEFDGVQSDPLLVVNGIQQVGQPACLSIEKSQFFTEDEKDLRVKGLAVDLYVNGTFKESLQVRDSIMTQVYLDWNDGNEIEVEELLYAFNYCEGQYLLCEGDQLRFEVHSSEFETAKAEVTMPDAPDVVGFDLLGIDSMNCTAKFALKLDDPVGMDYYNLCPRDGMVGCYSNDPVFADLMDMNVDDFLGENNIYYLSSPFNIISDTYFNGKIYTISFEAYFYGVEIAEPYTLELTRVDESLYRYKTTYEAYLASDPESLYAMFTEPVQVYSNVENGVGLVCAQSRSVINTIDLNIEKR